MDKLLLVEDDATLIQMVSDYLKNEGFSVTAVTGQQAASDTMDREKPDLALVDISLAEGNGFGVFADAKSRGIPVIFLTASSDEFSVVTGLDMGADDYISKPFDTKEVIARIKAIARRMGSNSSEPETKEVRYDKLVVNMTRYELRVNDKVLDTPPKELELLFYLASNPNHVYTRDQLLDEVWGFEYYGDSRTIDVHIKRLREKLQDVSPHWALKTVWGVGYKFEADEE